VQCQAHAIPLFKSLDEAELHTEIRQLLFTICRCLQQREYVKAHDAYILLAIGIFLFTLLLVG
jgi:hypothetical protein